MLALIPALTVGGTTGKFRISLSLDLLVHKMQVTRIALHELCDYRRQHLAKCQADIKHNKC